MPTKYLTNLELNHLPLANPTSLTRNPSNLDEYLLIDSLKPTNLREAAEFKMIPVARPYKPITSITPFNLDHYGIGVVEAALSPQSYVSPPNFTPPPPTHPPPEYLLRPGGRKKSRRKLKRKKRKTKRRKNKRKSRRRKVNKNKRKSRRRK